MDTNINLTKLTIDDAAEVYSSVSFSRPYLKKLIWSATATLESVSDYIQSAEKNNNKMFAIRKSETDEFAGVIELRDKNGYYEIGYWLDIRYRGHGYATQALKTIIKENDVPIHAQVRLENTKSQNVMKRAGMIITSKDETNYYYCSCL